jgi:hypothetical protein
MEKLIWIPLYVDALLASQRWRLMEDFERGWYFSLITESVRSERPGYLRLDKHLWRLAGARSEQFFRAKNSAVLACFKTTEVEGETWVFSERLVRTLEEQNVKLSKIKPPPSNSVLLDSKKTKEGVCPKCRDTGWRASELQPGKVKECECITTNA